MNPSPKQLKWIRCFLLGPVDGMFLRWSILEVFYSLLSLGNLHDFRYMGGALDKDQAGQSVSQKESTFRSLAKAPTPTMHIAGQPHHMPERCRRHCCCNLFHAKGSNVRRQRKKVSKDNPPLVMQTCPFGTRRIMCFCLP